jgi:hypothetical protein
MPATQPSKDLQPLCHEHHVEMTLNRSLLSSAGDRSPTMAYGCTESGCLVRYNISLGYFISSQNENGDEMDVPRIKCFIDGAPMYLAELSPEKRSFRLWTCPQCGARRTNEDGLVGRPSLEIRDVDGENAAESESTRIPPV